MFALITTLSTNLLRTYIIYRFMRLFFWTDIEEKKKERACYVLFFVLTAGVHLIFFSKTMSIIANIIMLYAVCTNLSDDEVSDILKVSEGRWQIEECFRIMKTDFSARPVYLRDEKRIKAHFLICFLALMIYRFFGRKLNYKYTCEESLDTLKAMNFAEIQEQGFIPL